MEEIAIVPSFNPLTAMSASASSVIHGDAGLGSEQLGASDVVIPRIGLLQPMSKAVASNFPGAVPGALWVKPHNRPATIPGDPMFNEMRLIVVRIFPSQRRWKSIKEGGGILCEASLGDYQARELNGLAGAKIVVEKTKAGIVRVVEWEGGKPTDRCVECVWGCGAAAAAAGRRVSLDAPVDRGNVWLPKLISVDGEMVKIPDALRAPVCTSSIDVLGLVLLPPFQGADAEIVPAFMVFQRTSMPAGKQIAGMIKIAARREPAWTKLFAVSSTPTTNDKGTFFVLNARAIGFAHATMVAEAAALYKESALRTYRAEFDDDDADRVVDVEQVASVTSDPAPKEDDKF